jgi:broad specificity phosphatase PhoE
VPAVHLVRHGQASFGTADYDVLSEAGHRQAALVAKALAGRGVRPAVLVSGTLRRQVGTAAAFGDAATDPRWNEYDLEELLAGSVEDTAEDDASRQVQAWLDRGLLAWSREAAGFTVWRDAARAALDDVLDAAGRGGAGVVVTSGGVIAAVVAAVLGLGPEGFVALNRVSVNTGITTLVRGRAGTSLLSFNEHGHLPVDDVTYR